MTDDQKVKEPETVEPNQTLYVQNLHEKTKVEALKKELYSVFSQHGRVLDVVAHRNNRLRGQAWVVYADQTAADTALAQLQGQPLIDRPMRLSYARQKSDAAAQLDGTFSEAAKQERKRQLAERLEQREEELRELKRRRKAEQEAAGGADGGGVTAGMNVGYHGQQQAEGGAVAGEAAAGALPDVRNQEPNKVLFVENLPAEADADILTMLFQRFPGFVEVRMAPGQMGVAFIEFQHEMTAGVALNGLQHFKISPEKMMRITFARK